MRNFKLFLFIIAVSLTLVGCEQENWYVDQSREWERGDGYHLYHIVENKSDVLIGFEYKDNHGYPIWVIEPNSYSYVEYSFSESPEFLGGAEKNLSDKIRVWFDITTDGNQDSWPMIEYTPENIDVYYHTPYRDDLWSEEWLDSDSVVRVYTVTNKDYEYAKSIYK